MISALLLWASLAWGQVPSEAVSLAQQQARVTELARIAANARDGGQSRSVVSAAMRAYRAEAEILAALSARADLAERDALSAARSAALREIEEALATGRPALGSRKTLSDWLGPLGPQLQLLDGAMVQVRANPESPLSRDLAFDLAERAQVLALVASYDASRARAEVEQLELRARALRARAASGMSGGMEELMEAKELEDRAGTRRAEGSSAEALAAQALLTWREALELAGGQP